MQLHHILSEGSEKSKRNMMVFAAVCLFIALTGERPSEIPLLGMEFDTVDQQSAVAYSFLVVMGYLYVRFLVLTWVDTVNWMEKVQKEGYMDGYKLPARELPLAKKLKLLWRALRSSKLLLIDSLNQFLEVFVPIFFGAMGLAAAYVVLG